MPEKNEKQLESVESVRWVRGVHPPTAPWRNLPPPFLFSPLSSPHTSPSFQSLLSLEVGPLKSS